MLKKISVILLLITLFGCAISTQKEFNQEEFNENITNDSNDNQSVIDDNNEIEEKSAEEIVEETATIINKIDANSSQDMQTEAEAFNYLNDRKLSQEEIIHTNDINGNVYEPKVVINTSSEKHPIYETYYITNEGNAWYIYVINGRIIAIPTFFNSLSTFGRQVVISENETILSYDSENNVFYETKLDDDSYLLIVVERIDSDFFENTTLEKIKEMK